MASALQINPAEDDLQRIQRDLERALLPVAKQFGVSPSRLAELALLRAHNPGMPIERLAELLAPADAAANVRPEGGDVTTKEPTTALQDAFVRLMAKRRERQG